MSEGAVFTTWISVYGRTRRSASKERPMRLTIIVLLCLLPLLTACDSVPMADAMDSENWVRPIT